MLSSNDMKNVGLCVVGYVAVAVAWYLALAVAPSDANQGQVYRILFVHVPSAAMALGLCTVGLLVTAIVGLVKVEERFLLAQQAWVEIGLIFTTLTLITGSIWGKPTWGTWWTWDARLTTTFLMEILLIAFLFLMNSLQAGRSRIRVCSILSLIICIDAPIIYKSVEWWRTLHQPASLIESRGKTMAPEMLQVLLISLAATTVLAIGLWWLRFGNLKLRAKTSEVMLEAVRN